MNGLCGCGEYAKPAEDDITHCGKCGLAFSATDRERVAATPRCTTCGERIIPLNLDNVRAAVGLTRPGWVHVFPRANRSHQAMPRSANAT